MRLIDADAYPCAKCGSAYCITNCDKYWAWFHATVDAAPQWISVEDRLPEIDQEVLIRTNEGLYDIAQFTGTDRFWTLERNPSAWVTAIGVTHWMPLPPAPKEVNHE